ncbi:hypothetical protein HU764_008500 [Pseudomonas sp. SWRI100]|uniref:hypothetical protein n=1 Tax=Pseudomonas TaxID=286 RepID=UPI0016451640|nr:MULTISPECIES: hypothetical protein [Pseudomonas]MBC3496801.1 hypothetical protein [Pseudomonas sp. SWRI67]MBV4526137.1 hypothetical protein [Pseudomonas kermanshahensis]
MKLVTIVVENPVDPIRLGMRVAGGRVTAAGIGDYFSYAELLEAAKDLVLLIEDGVPPRHEALEAAAQAARELITKLEAQ